MAMIPILLLLSVFALLVYLFATKDKPYIPAKSVNTKSKQDVINWPAWRGEMFVEDFNGSSFTPVPDDVDICPPTLDSPPNDAMFEGFGNYMLPLDIIRQDKGGLLPLTKEHKITLNDHLDAYGKCITSKLSTSEKAYQNEYHNCSYKMMPPNKETGDLGNFKQCTNNNLDAPNNLRFKSQGRWDYDITNPCDRVSHVCYAKNLKH
jgi:hypothetical protein